MDRQMLRVEGLEPGVYQLSIDGKAVASFTREELQQGVNLALVKTPMLEQALGVDWSEDRRIALDLARFILSAEVKQSATSTAAEAKLWDGEDELAAAIRKDAEPKPHHFELRRQQGHAAGD
jgi:hypothetical protein